MLTTPEIWRMGDYLGDGRLKRLAHFLNAAAEFREMGVSPDL